MSPMAVVVFSPVHTPASVTLLAALRAASLPVVVATDRATARQGCSQAPRAALVLDLRDAGPDELLDGRTLARECPATRRLVLRSAAVVAVPDGDAVLTEPFFAEQVVRWCMTTVGRPPDDGVLADLAAGLSHEVLNPLTSMLMQIEMLRADGSERSVEELAQLSLLEQSGKRIQAVVRDVAAASERQPIEGAVTEVATLLDSARARLAAQEAALVERLTLGSSSGRVRIDLPLVATALADLWAFLLAAGTGHEPLEVGIEAIDGSFVILRHRARTPRLPEDAAGRLFTPLWARQALGLPDKGPSLTSARAAFRRHGGDLVVRSQRGEQLVVEGLLPRDTGADNGLKPPDPSRSA